MEALKKRRTGRGNDAAAARVKDQRSNATWPATMVAFTWPASS
jgi:hypothetical protein